MRRFCAPLEPAGKRAGFLWAGANKNPVRFRGAAAGIQAPVPRPPCRNVHRNEVRFRRFLAGGTPPPAPKIKGGGQAPLGLARLNHRKANPGGAVKVGAESAMHFNLDGPGWVCYLFRSLEFVLFQGFGCFSVVQHYNRKRQYLPNHDSYNLHTVRFTI